MTKQISSHTRITTLLIVICIAVMLASCGTMAGLSQSKPKSLLTYDEQAKEILATMTLDEKIGQMIQSEYVGMQDKNDIQKYFLGSVLMGGGSDPAAGNSLEAWTDVYDEVQSIAMKTRLGIPVMYGVDAVHGHSNVIGATIFPHNIALGCTNNPELIEKIGKITAIEMQATGMNWTFAPCVTVVRDERWGRTYEGFSEEPEIASILGAASTRGLQGNDLSDPLAVAACAKHYIADGGTSAVTSQGRGGPAFGGFNFGGAAMTTRGGTRVTLNAGNSEFDEDTLRKIHLPPYKACVDAGVATIMPSYSSWNGTKCSASKFLLTDLLKGELGFKGFLISDYNAIDQINMRNFKEAIAISINAGMDMAMEPTRYAEFFTFLKELVEEGTVPMSRIDDAVTRILRVKIAMGLFDDSRSHLTDRKLHEIFGSKEHRKVARQAVRESLVLLKNNNEVLPVAKNTKKIFVAGINGNDIGNQCGGWTIQWQGQSGNDLTEGTTILQGIKDIVSSDTEVVYSRDGSGAAGSDVAIVFVGEERPYAEGSGDNGDLSLSAQQVEMINSIKSEGIPVVAVIISGRPMIIGDILDKADAIVAAWYPGTEGQGVADVLFGDYKPTGKLSFTWPKSMDQIPINVGDSDYDPLYEFGFGLSY
ncbi:MAG: glycoside hydrolase family 3 C-terminal domain-containing protein [Sedimentisphaerales bacterium]|nr:glycoside hydrolase family 3 C-terminal domain-containing protein [Sedimentisphaerales bacterium]